MRRKEYIQLTEEDMIVLYDLIELHKGVSSFYFSR